MNGVTEPQQDPIVPTRGRCRLAFMPLAIACRVVLALLLAALASAAAAAATADTKPAEATLKIANRDIAVFRATLLGNGPDVRAERARERIGALTDADFGRSRQGGCRDAGRPARDIDSRGRPVAFSLLPGDVDPEDKLTLEQVAEQARAHLEEALRAKRDQRKLPVLLSGLAHAAVVTVLLGALFWLFHRAGHAPHRRAGAARPRRGRRRGHRAVARLPGAPAACGWCSWCAGCW